MKKLIIANWKSYLTNTQSIKLLKNINSINFPKRNYNLIIAPNASFLCCINKYIDRKKLDIAAQNVYPAYQGAYTGVITVSILKELKVKYCIVGHSESRLYQKESSKDLNGKIKILLQHGITPIYCFGDSFDQYKNKRSFEAVKNKLSRELKRTDIEKIIYAYEPVWAISGFKNSKAAPLNFVKEMHNKIKAYIGKNIKILYGGSIDIKNINQYLESEEIDGLLVGSASTKINFFKNIK